MNGKYQVSNLGQIRRLKSKKSSRRKNAVIIKYWKILKLDYCNGRGYVNTTLSKDGTIAKKVVHRLVAEAFIPNPKNKPFVNHINGIKTDNRVENLEWCTNSENIKHAFNTSLMKPMVGKDNPNYGKMGGKSSVSIKVNQYSMDGKFIRQWDCIAEAKRSIGANNISACCKGIYKYSGGFKWKYAENTEVCDLYETEVSRAIKKLRTEGYEDWEGMR